MPGSFYRSERKKQGGTNVKKQNKEGDAVGRKGKAFSVLQSISRSMSSLQKGCVNLFYSQVGRDKISLQELNKDSLVYNQAEGQGPPGKPLNMIIITKGSQRKFSKWSQNWLSPCNSIKLRDLGFCVCKPLGSLNYAPQLSGANPFPLFTLLLEFSQLLSSHHRG